MQASKIIPNSVYAIKHGDKLVRFGVRKVITTQTRTMAKSSPHDYASVVIGNIREEGCPDTELKLAPEAILGPYREYAELEARRQAEEEAAKKAKAEFEAMCQELCEKLYELSGLTPPDHGDRYKRPFRQDYASIQINSEAVGPLLTALRGVARLRAVS